MPRRTPNYVTMNYDARRNGLDLKPTARKRQLNRIFVRDRGICQLCFFPCKRADASRDHIKSVVECATKEEATHDSNVQLAHILCNNLKEQEERKATKSSKIHVVMDDEGKHHLGYKIADAYPELLDLYKNINGE